MVDDWVIKTMYATKRRRRNTKCLKMPTGKECVKSNPSKRHRERLNSELDHLASLLPFDQTVISKLDKLSILRLGVSYLRMKCYFQIIQQDRLLSEHRLASHLYHFPYDLACKESEAHLQAMNGFIFVVSCDGEVFSASRTVEFYLGFHQSDILHQSVLELIHSEDREEFRRQLMWNSQLSSAEKRRWSYRDILEPDKSHLLQRCFSVRFRCLLDNTSGFITLEISGRLQAIRGQATSRNASNGDPPLGLFAMCSPFGNMPNLDAAQRDMTFKTKHKLDLAIIGMDVRAKASLGYPEKESPRLKCYHLLHPDDCNYVARGHKEILKPGNIGNIGFLVHRWQHKNSSWIWLQSSCKMISKAGDRDSIMITHRQLTEEEGRELLTRRSYEYKLPFPLLEPETLISEDDDESQRVYKTTNRRPRSQMKEYLQASRRRKTPYRDVPTSGSSSGAVGSAAAHVATASYNSLSSVAQMQQQQQQQQQHHHHLQHLQQQHHQHHQHSQQYLAHHALQHQQRGTNFTASHLFFPHFIQHQQQHNFSHHHHLQNNHNQQQHSHFQDDSSQQQQHQQQQQANDVHLSDMAGAASGLSSGDLTHHLYYPHYHLQHRQHQHQHHHHQHQSQQEHQHDQQLEQQQHLSQFAHPELMQSLFSSAITSATAMGDARGGGDSGGGSGANNTHGSSCSSTVATNSSADHSSSFYSNEASAPKLDADTEQHSQENQANAAAVLQYAAVAAAYSQQQQLLQQQQQHQQQFQQHQAGNSTATDMEFDSYLATSTTLKDSFLARYADQSHTVDHPMSAALPFSLLNDSGGGEHANPEKDNNNNNVGGAPHDVTTAMLSGSTVTDEEYRELKTEKAQPSTTKRSVTKNASLTKTIPGLFREEELVQPGNFPVGKLSVSESATNRSEPEELAMNGNEKLQGFPIVSQHAHYPEVSKKSRKKAAPNSSQLNTTSNENTEHSHSNRIQTSISKQMRLSNAADESKINKNEN